MSTALAVVVTALGSAVLAFFVVAFLGWIWSLIWGPGVDWGDP